ncbi:Trehalase 1 [Spatholobus suberectus]|nr:Trehalase 1 [Spatholobus suberectus]
MENNGSLISKEKIDQVAMWLGSTVSSAFFSSLERFSCVNIATSDPDNDDDDDDDYYSTTAATPTAASTATAVNHNTNPPSAEINGQNTNDVSNLPV